MVSFNTHHLGAVGLNFQLTIARPRRKGGKGSDLIDGSDVKAANCWKAIDTPRFNGVIPSGRVSKTSKKAADISALDDIPFIFLVLWDEKENNLPRCRVWCVHSSKDDVFRKVCAKWYEQKASGKITSNNFQLHPPRNKDINVIRNSCGNLELPLLFCAVRQAEKFTIEQFDEEALKSGRCRLVQ